MTIYPEWARVESPEEDRKLLFRFDPRGLQIEIVTRRRLGGEWQRVKEILPLLPHFGTGLAGSIHALIAQHLPVPLPSPAGTAML